MSASRVLNELLRFKPTRHHRYFAAQTERLMAKVSAILANNINSILNEKPDLQVGLKKDVKNESAKSE